MKKQSLLTLLLSASPAIFAGQFSINYYGPAGANDISSEVTDEFTKAYPFGKYEIYLYSDAGQLSGGKRYCYAIAGVIPKNSKQMPSLRYTSMQVTNDSYDDVMNVGEINNSAAICARGAVKNMMSDKMSNIYKPNKKAL